MDEGVSKTAGIIDRYKLPIGLCVIGIVLIIGGLLLSSKPAQKIYPRESLTESQKFITVDVSGGVNKPGVYKIKDSGRVEDAISAAGGFSDDAQTEYIARVLNLAARLADGSKVYVPKEGEAAVAVSSVSSVAGTNISSQININTASASELDSLSQVGSVTAQKIISGRPYQAIEELVSKKVVGKALFDKIKDQLVIY